MFTLRPPRTVCSSSRPRASLCPTGREDRRTTSWTERPNPPRTAARRPQPRDTRRNGTTCSFSELKKTSSRLRSLTQTEEKYKKEKGKWPLLEIEISNNQPLMAQCIFCARFIALCWKGSRTILLRLSSNDKAQIENFSLLFLQGDKFLFFASLCISRFISSACHVSFNFFSIHP